MLRDLLSRNDLAPDDKLTFSARPSDEWAASSGPDANAPFLFRTFVTGLYPDPDSVRIGRPDLGPQAFQPPTGGVGPTPPGLPVFSWDQAAAQLTRSGTSWSHSLGTPGTVTYGFRSSAPIVMPNGTSGFSQFSPAQIAAAETALQLWSDVANINFVRANPGGYTNNATILFANYFREPAQESAFAFFPGSTLASATAGDVWVNLAVPENSNLTLGTFGPQVLAHELGHAIGISHPADYDASDATPPTYEANAVYWQDSRAFTIMSYFGSPSVGFALGAFAAGPQLHDIAAAQLLYGPNMTTRTGDTVYGFNSNTGREHYTITADGQAPVFAIWDAGGVDTLDLSGYSTPVEIDLREEAFSSAGPSSQPGVMAHGNIAIARGAVIENAIGGSGNDTLIGNAVANILSGGVGADLLDGGSGADAMAGGAGDDTYVVDNAGDTVSEGAGAGTDTVQASVTFSLSGNVENLVLTGVGAISGFGNVLNNSITGNGAANQLNGFDGADTLDGGAGADNMFGGNGDDVYFVDNAGDLTTEVSALGGIDTVFSSVTRNLTANIENLTLTGVAAITGAGNVLNNIIIGNAAANTLYGFDGNDRLDGAAGADTLFGAAGDDTYVVDDGGDITVEGIAGPAGGIDTVESSISRNLNANFENLVLTGIAAATGYGNVLDNAMTGNGAANSLYGFDGADTLDGGGGADSMFGGNGDDTYVVDNAADVTSEASALGGIDTVLSSVTRNLTANLENLTLTGGDAITGAGNALNNVLIGNSAANTLFGLDGADTLDGGLGADTLQGGAGADAYVFSSALGAGNVDTIVNFSVADDVIELSTAVFTGLAAGVLDAAAFVIGSAAADADDRIIYDSATGALWFDADGSGAAAQIQFASLAPALALTNDDFLGFGP
jgi:Ca2+-binding RTX toxin-like protein